MEESKALGLEFKGLFETIKRQALEYSKAFEFFEEEKKELVRKQIELQQIAKLLTEEVDEKIQFLEEKITTFTTSFEEKHQNFLEIYGEIENIRTLGKELQTLQSVLKSRLLEIENLLISIQNKYMQEFQNVQNELIQKLDNELDSAIKKMDVKYALKFKSLDDKFISIEQKLLNQTITQSRQSKILFDDIDTLKDILQNIKSMIYEERQNIEARFNEFNEELNKKLKMFDQIANKVGEQTETTIQSQEEGTTKIKDEIRQLFQQLNEIRATNIKQSTKLKQIVFYFTISLLLIIGMLFIIK
ncbi:MAG: hypothetical protein ACUVQ1_03170 [Candidatus Kapaibacteriales bacterium]